MNAQTLVAKVWNFAHVLRDQGVSYQAYISQISYLLFLKMDEERVTQIGEASMLPDGARWGDIKDLSGEALNAAYVKLLDQLSKQGGIIGAIFLKAQSEIQDPAKLKRLVGLIDSEVWLGLPVDVKGDIYEGLLARNAEDVKSGAGQYFTPRPVIEAMVQVVGPKPHQTVHDPACGTAGFLLAAWEHMKKHPKARDRAVYSALKGKFSGVDIVPEVVRLAAMNLYLHGITGVDSIVEAKDALLGAGGKSYEVILTNPPLGKKQSYSDDAERGVPPIRELLFFALIYTDVGSNASAIPADIIDDLLDALDQALAPSAADQITNGGRQTLGGLVYDCRVEGDVECAPGDLQGKGQTLVPIKVTLKQYP